ncbi:MAG: hypothetical protein J7647_29215 [Cyanobacteria bacterium SBLK]|nr:hypothetical protein [Cyanobacteria bacterium SBLK]
MTWSVTHRKSKNWCVTLLLYRSHAGDYTAPYWLKNLRERSLVRTNA